MKQIPILFSTEMVKAILEGRKTMTRRIIDPQPESGKYPQSELDGFYWKNKFYLPKYNRKDISLVDNSRYGQPGDVLWVRETFGIYLDAFLFKAGDFNIFKGIKWKPSIHMPKDYARIWLQVEEIRVERLKDITEEDAIAEGVSRYINSDNKVKYLNYLPAKPGHVKREKHFGHGYKYSEAETARYSFQTLWIKINGEECWDSNPWVWVVKFKVLSTTGKPQLETLNLKLETI